MANPSGQGFGAGGQQGGTARGGSTQQPQQGGAGGGVGAVKEKVQDFTSAVASKAEDAWDSTRSAVQSAGSAVARTAEDTWDNLTICMRRYPLATFAAGIGVGLLLATLLRGNLFRGTDYVARRMSEQHA
jgi:hypothetical protein